VIYSPWDQLEKKVDRLVEALIEEKRLPGMTVAIAKAGRLILAFDADIDIGIKAHAPKSAKWKEWYGKITNAMCN
jgi:CubicO group peptidase (beta-lactamase class C family)